MEIRCENYIAPSYDPTGEWAVPCEAPARYCETCEMALCPHCHEELAPARHRKAPVRETAPPAARRRSAG